MQDHSHKLLFLGLTGLMSAAAFYGSEAGPTLLLGNDVARPVVSATFAPAPSNTAITAKLATDRTCSEVSSERSPLCRGASKVVLSGH